MIEFLGFLLLAALPQSDFDEFRFCREGVGAPDELYCVELDASGSGTFRFSSNRARPEEVPLALSAAAAARFRLLLENTSYLRDGENYESNRRVANLGRKTVSVEGAWGAREAVYNYSTLREVTELTTFFERLIAQELLIFETGVAMDFDRLGIPRKLDQIEKDLQTDRFVDPERLIPLLDQIEQNPRLVNFARTTAARLKREIQSGN